MADLSITAIAAIEEPGTLIQDRTSTESFAVGQPMYLNTSQYSLADGTDTDKLEVVGITIVAGSTGDYPIMVTNGARISLTGPTLTKGLAYYLSGSGTAGKIAPYADLGSGDSVIQLGIASTTAILDVKIVIPSPAITL